MIVGSRVMLGWNAAKRLGDEGLAGETVRIEAIGSDWVILRPKAAPPIGEGFKSPRALVQFFAAINN